MASEKSTSDETSHHDHEREVFTRFYAKLCELLPVTVEESLPQLVTSNVISLEEEEEILTHSTSSSKARAILKPIRKALFEEIPRPFHQFLTVMQSSRHTECAELARQIYSELNIMNTSTTAPNISHIITQPKLSHHMSTYRKFLQSKYKSLELISIDEQLDCSSSKYITLSLVKIDKQGRTTTTENRRGDSVTLSEALDVEGEIKKVILIKGGPGMGKSTLAINICKCWAAGSLLQTYDAVILLTLRTKKIQEAQTVNDLFISPDDELKRKVFTEVVADLGERICFLLEGYDELPYQLRKSSVFTEVRDSFPKSTLVYTSRPEACDKLESVACRIITIEGFRKESVNEYISNTFSGVEDGNKLTLKLKSQLHRNSALQRILNVPINVAIVCLIFFYYSTLPDTLTELYTLLCLRLILRHITTRTVNVAQVEELRLLDDLPEDIAKQFSQLCFIAYKGVETNKMIFSSQELRSIGVVQVQISDLGLLVTAPSTSVYGREKSYNFVHKTLQEFCTAWYISKLSLEDQLKCINTYWDDGSYRMVWRFYSGITGLSNKEVLNCILPYKLVKSGLTQRRVQCLMYCMYEAHNSKLCQIVGDHFDDNIKYDVTYVLDYFLTLYNGTLKQIHGGNWDDDNFQIVIKSLQRRQSRCDDRSLILNISYCIVTHQSFRLLVDLLSTSYPIVELKIRAIKFQSTSDMDSPGHYPNLNVTSTHLSDIQLLSQVFISSNTLRVLDISGTDIGPEGAASFSGLRNVLIRDLRMAGCKLGPTGADKIGEMLYHNNSIVSVDFSSNDIKDSGMEKMVHHLSSTNLQNLNLWGNRITAVGANHLRRLIATDHPTLTSIELSWNPLEDEGVYVILSSLTAIMEYIGLRGVAMTSLSWPIISVSFEKLKSCCFDPPDDCEVISLANTTVLKQLKLVITSDSANHKMLSAIRQSDNIEMLKLEYWNAKEWVVDITELLKHCKALTKLAIVNYEQPPQDILLIVDSLTVNTSLRQFKYGDNYMGQNTAINFVKKLKQALTVEEVTLGVSRGANYDYHFLGDVEKCVQQINLIRSTRGFPCLKVEITVITLF